MFNIIYKSKLVTVFSQLCRLCFEIHAHVKQTIICFSRESTSRKKNLAAMNLDIYKISPSFVLHFFLLMLRPVSIHNAIKLAVVDLNIPANRPTNH